MIPTLAEVLADLYPTTGSIQRILDEAQISVGRINLNDSAINIWNRALDIARDNQQMWDLVQIPLREYDKNQELRAAWEAELSHRRGAVAQTGKGDTQLSLLIDLIWDTRTDQKEIRKEVSELRNESKNRLGTLELLTASLKALQEGQAADIIALKERPETYSTRIVLTLAVLAGAFGGLFAAWGRMLLLWIARIVAGG